MNDSRQHIPEERFSIAGAINNFRDWFIYILNSWKRVLIFSVIIGALFFAYKSLKKTNYTAATSFVLQNESGGELGQLSSIASLAGVNLGALTESSALFQLDNIVELYRSYSMLRKTFMTKVDHGGKIERLVTWYAESSKLSKSWEENGINFEIPDNQILIRHDSVLKEIVEDILERNLQVGKPNRRLGILRVAYESTDELFSKAFNSAHVSNVNTFYLDSKTRKTGENLRVLSFQADSVKRVVDGLLESLANFEERNPNLNPLRVQAQVPRQKLQIDLAASSVVYQEIVKNLEIAKVAHRNNTPLIQIIDEPVLPLEDDHWKWYKSLIIGIFVGGVIGILMLTLQRAYRSIMTEGS